jgi:uncharacterized protein (TIGR00369 family)
MPEPTPTGNEAHYRRLEAMYRSAPINAFFQPAIRVSEGAAEIVVPVRRELFHAAGAVHGAAYFKVLDDAAFFATNSLVEDFFVLTVSFELKLLRPVTEGELRAAGRVVFRSRRLYVAESVVVDAEGAQVGRGSGTFLPSAIPLTPEIGYRLP